MDLDAVAAWMSEQGLGEGPLSDVTELAGGTQNVMVRFTRSGRDYVLRRGPHHLRPASNTVILRETRVLAALAGTGVPHPALIAACPDPGVLGDAVFYLMEPVEGFNAGQGLPALHAGDAAIRHRMGLSMADALARLGAVDYRAVGLGDFGKPDGFLDRQVPRWLSELESYTRFEDYPGPQIPGVAEVAAWLQREQPSVWTPGIMHGDYHAANVMFSLTGPEVAAIVDWEMCTIGDPLLDLGWLLATWPDPSVPPVLEQALTGYGGWATHAEIIDRYSAASSRDLTAITWYTVLACFKLGIVLEGTLARAYAGKAPREVGEQLHAAAVRLFERAQVLTDSR